MVPVHSEGLELHRIEMLGGGREFCQEFFTDVRIPDADRIGEVDDGWTVGIRWLFHERSFAMSPYIIGMARWRRGIRHSREALIRLARQAGTIEDPGPGHDRRGQSRFAGRGGGDEADSQASVPAT